MLRNIKEIEGCTIGASDGIIGRVTDVSWAKSTVSVDLK
jgi:hypothetical protein